MNVWLVTTGSSDVQLSNKDGWNDWWQAVKVRLYRLRFEPSEAIEDEKYYRLPARVLGIVDDQMPDRVHPHLVFPLLQNFTQALKEKNIPINEIIVLTSDQENIFPEAQRESKRCPYWQDTCQIYPSLKRYFSKHFPAAVVKSLPLKPEQPHQGLDNWDEVLKLVQQEFAALSFGTEPHTVYISHQGGTPAISSAVQFAGLARFGDRVKFLLSNEQNKNLTTVVESSRYLLGIKSEQAKKLLTRYDYAGVSDLLQNYPDTDVQILLNAAIQWNAAEFEKYSEELLKLSGQKYQALVQMVKHRREHCWWWIAYEELYLAFIRKEQGNIVEAFFHSFRTFEGIFAAWGAKEFGQHIELWKGVPCLKPSILDDLKSFFSDKACKKVNGLKSLRSRLEEQNTATENSGQVDRIKLDLATLCKIFRAFRYDDYKLKCGELKIFWDDPAKNNNVSEKRNFIVHQVQGMSESQLWEFWGVSSMDEWQERLFKFLNFIAETNLSKDDASFMVQVHQELSQWV